MEEKILYRTPSLDLATTLLYLGNDVVGIDVLSNKKQSFFLFSNSNNLDLYVSDYWNGKLSSKFRIEPKDFLNSRKELLERLKESMRKREDGD